MSLTELERSSWHRECAAQPVSHRGLIQRLREHRAAGLVDLGKALRVETRSDDPKGWSWVKIYDVATGLFVGGALSLKDARKAIQEAMEEVDPSMKKAPRKGKAALPVTVYYDGKIVDMSYVPDPTMRFSLGCSRVLDNAREGYIKQGNEVCHLIRGKKSARILKGEEREAALALFSGVTP